VSRGRAGPVTRRSRPSPARARRWGNILNTPTATGAVRRFGITGWSGRPGRIETDIRWLVPGPPTLLLCPSRPEAVHRAGGAPECLSRASPGRRRRRPHPGDSESGGHERQTRHGRSARPCSAYARAGPGEAWPRGCSSSKPGARRRACFPPERSSSRRLCRCRASPSARGRSGQPGDPPPGCVSGKELSAAVMVYPLHGANASHTSNLDRALTAG
jgi:hypothetical protein